MVIYTRHKHSFGREDDAIHASSVLGPVEVDADGRQMKFDPLSLAQDLSLNFI